MSVDHDLCIGSATCTSVAPEAFELNAEGQSVVVDPAAYTRQSLLDAASLCPVSAIVVTDAVSGARVEQ